VVPVCLAPDHIDRVNLISTTLSTITLGWEAPWAENGCPTLGFRLFLDIDGSGYDEVDPNFIRDKPYLNQYTVTDLWNVGKVHKFKI
jgi:hypothetical protein